MSLKEIALRWDIFLSFRDAALFFASVNVVLRIIHHRGRTDIAYSVGWLAICIVLVWHFADPFDRLFWVSFPFLYSAVRVLDEFGVQTSKPMLWLMGLVFGRAFLDRAKLGRRRTKVRLEWLKRWVHDRYRL